MALATNPDGRQEALAQTPARSMDAFAARYDAPRLYPEMVPRTELLARLDRARGCPLVLLTAPAGYGKTTLLAQWGARAQRPVAWVGLGEATASGGVADAILTALEWIEIDPSRPRCSFALVFDDAHVADRAELGEALLDVLGWLPDGSQIAVASRSEPALPLGRMRGRRMVIELGPEDLSMSSVEAATLIRTVGIDLEFTAIQDLARRTEGWPVALELAASSLLARSDPEDSAAHLAGDDNILAEYFRLEFLDPLPPAMRRFLIRSSTLERLSGPLCDAVLERERSAQMLARLSRANVPITPADPSHEWYRVHGLFREMLQTELRRAEPELERSLHKRGAYWCRQAGDIDGAIGHACAAGDLAQAGELLWAHLPSYLGEGRNDAVARWLTGVTAEQATGYPSLALAAAHSQLSMGRIAHAEQWTRSAAVSLCEEAATAGTATDPQRAGVLIVEAWAARSGVTRMGDDAARAYALLPDDSAWRADCCLLRGTSALLTGSLADAEQHFEEGAARAASLLPDRASSCLAQLAVLALERDDSQLAGELAWHARDTIKQQDDGTHPAVALVFAVSAAADVVQGRVDEAKSAAARATRLIGLLEDFAPWYVAETRILLARGLLALGDAVAAREQLAEASRLARRTRDAVVFQRWFDDAWDQFDRRAETALVGAGSLTTAELRVLRFLPTHFSFHEIAERLNVSSNTVKTHVHAIYRKLDASSRSQAVANAGRAGLLGY